MGITIGIIAVLLLWVYLAIRSIRKNKKNGCTGCGSSCGGCAYSGACHEQEETENKKLNSNLE